MEYYERYGGQVDSFVSVCHALASNFYTTSHGGNLAWKLEDDLLLITPTRMNKGDIAPQDVVFVNTTGSTVEGKRKPTGELPMYLNFFGERPDITSVIHCHPPVTGAFAIVKEVNWLMRPVLPETTIEVGPVPVVPYGEPLTQRLADNFLPFLRRYNAFLMQNHGLVIISPRDIVWTHMLVELLEMTSVSLVAALAMGEIEEIGKEDVRDLDNVMKTRGLPMFGAPGVNSSLVAMYFTE